MTDAIFLHWSWFLDSDVPFTWKHDVQEFAFGMLSKSKAPNGPTHVQ